MNPYILGLLIVGVFSTGASFSVVLTLLLFKNLRAKIFMQFIAFISIADFFGNLPYVFPYRPPPGSAVCDFFGFLNIASYPISWLWTLVLSYFLYSLSMYGAVPDKKYLPYIHCVCWLYPIVAACIEAGFQRFEYGLGNGVDVCSSGHDPAMEIYHSITFYGVFLATILAMLILRIKLIYHRFFSAHAATAALRALWIYPAILSIFWLPHFITVEVNCSFLIYYIFLIFKICHGLAAAVVFYASSAEARASWQGLICDLLGIKVITRMDSVVNSSFVFDVSDSSNRSISAYEMSGSSASTLVEAGQGLPTVYNPTQIISNADVVRTSSRSASVSLANNRSVSTNEYRHLFD